MSKDKLVLKDFPKVCDFCQYSTGLRIAEQYLGGE
jgi:hypothetical protein